MVAPAMSWVAVAMVSTILSCVSEAIVMVTLVIPAHLDVLRVILGNSDEHGYHYNAYDHCCWVTGQPYGNFIISGPCHDNCERHTRHVYRTGA